MKVPSQILEHKTLSLAVLIAADEIRREFALEPDLSLSSMSQQLDANRESVYEQLKRVSCALGDLATARPGRPPAEPDAVDSHGRAALELTIRVLQFRVEHLDAVVEHRSRSNYSQSFRRFILEELDVWEGTQETFAKSARVPLDTLTDWVRDDRAGIVSTPPEREPVPIPVDASEITRQILEDYAVWEGSTKSFIGITAQRCDVTPNQVKKVLAICAAITKRDKRRHRHRGSTKKLYPGSLLVTDGKTIDILLTGSGRRISLNWQAMLDQATGCVTGSKVSDQEDAAATWEAFDRSVFFLGGVAPEGLLHDNKPCYQDAGLQQQVRREGTIMVPATMGRPENKAIAEATFSLYEALVGTIRLDDSSMTRLVHSTVTEVLRAYTGAINGLPRPELKGQSRKAVLRYARPSARQKAADREFIRRLKAAHERQQRSDWRQRIKPISRRLINHVFERLGLTGHDPKGRLREFLATYDPATIRQAAAIVSRKLERGDVDRQHAHRYLTKVIQNHQQTLDMERQSEELLALNRLQAQDWVAMERTEYEQLQSDRDPDDLVFAVAERAAMGGLPVAGSYWAEKLMELLTPDSDLTEQVRRFLTRFGEAPAERRLLLPDQLAAFQMGTA